MALSSRLPCPIGVSDQSLYSTHLGCKSPYRQGRVSLKETGTLYAQAGGHPLPVQNRTKLFLYWRNFNPHDAEELARERYSMRDQRRILPINSWAHLKARLHHFNPIDELVINAHGADGAINLGTPVAVRLDEKKVKSLFLGKGIRINTITIDGCNVGRGPESMFGFAKLFHATSISAYTWYSKVFHVILPRGLGAQKIKLLLDQFGKFCLGTQYTLAQLVTKCSTGNVGMRFYFFGPDQDQLLPPDPNKLATRALPHHFKAYNQATTYAIRWQATLAPKAIEFDYKNAASNQIKKMRNTQEFYRVTVNVRY